MDFQLTDEQIALQESVARFLGDELEQTRLLRIAESESGHDPDLWRGLGQLGVLGITIPEEYGGIGLGMLDLAIVAEVLGNAAAPGPFLGHVLAALAIAEGGSPEQRERLLPALATGERIGTVALGEPGERWQPEQWQLVGASTLTGTKTTALYPDLADVIVVGVAGGNLMLVENAREGLEVTSLPCLDVTRRIANVAFDGVAATPLAVPGHRVRDAGLILLAADAFGGGRRCVDMTVDYAMTREQFGRVIAGFQALKHQLANMAVDIEPSCGLYWYAAHAYDAVPEDLAHMAAVAKAHIADRYLNVAREATQAHGGIGYTWEYPLHIWLKRAVFDRTYLGSSTVHRARSAVLSGRTESASCI